jgi:cell division protein ZapA (FtsZ GTPase activity inhibitor)
MAQAVTRALHAIRRYGAGPEQIDHAILAAINVTLCLLSGGNDRVAEGFNSDIALNGRGFGRAQPQLRLAPALADV